MRSQVTWKMQFREMIRQIEGADITRFEQIMLYSSICTPVLVGLAILFQAWNQNFASNVLGAGAGLLVGSYFLARFLWRRSRRLEATFFTVRILPSDDETTKLVTDCAALLGLALISLIACLLPFLIYW